VPEVKIKSGGKKKKYDMEIRAPEIDIMQSIKNNPGSENAPVSLADRLAARKQQEMVAEPISGAKPLKQVEIKKKTAPVRDGGILSFFSKQ
jgi:hypothetical protein